MKLLLEMKYVLTLSDTDKAQRYSSALVLTLQRQKTKDFMQPWHCRLLILPWHRFLFSLPLAVLESLLLHVGAVMVRLWFQMQRTSSLVIIHGLQLRWKFSINSASLTLAVLIPPVSMLTIRCWSRFHWASKEWLLSLSTNLLCHSHHSHSIVTLSYITRKKRFWKPLIFNVLNEATSRVNNHMKRAPLRCCN